MALDTMTVADWIFQIAKAEITGTLQVVERDGTNPTDPNGYSLSWKIEVRAQEFPLIDPKTNKLITKIEPVFSHQEPSVPHRDWRQWAGQEIVFDAETDDSCSEVPIFAIGGGDMLMTSALRVGARDGNRFPFEWSGTCYPRINEHSGLDPFRIVGTFTVPTFTVIFYDEGGDWEQSATRLLQTYCPMPGLLFRDARKPYATADVAARFQRLVHATFETDPSV